MSKTILIVDDEKDLQELVRFNLEKEGFDVIVARDSASGLEIALRHKPDLIVLDLMMPGLDGLEICRRLRADERGRRLPILMLTARSTEADRIVGLEFGADDYVTKPFSPRELVARIKAILRRTGEHEEAEEVIRREKLILDIGARSASYDQKPVELTATEFRILQFMARRPGRAIQRDEIITGALDSDSNVFDRTIDVHITAIRRKLREGAHLIETVRGFGYRFHRE
jgi:DNA-binding response OmpR family regulator